MVKRILVFNVNWLGDVVLSTPVLRAIRENHPDSFIACAIPQRCREILEGCPWLDEIIFFDERVSHRSLWEKIQFVLELRKRKFDTAYVIHRSLTRALMCFLAGISRRIGYDSPKRGWLLTQRIWPLPKDGVHRADYYLGIVEGAGLKISSRQCEFFLDDGHRACARNKLMESGWREGERFAVLHTGANQPMRRWSPEQWAVLVDRIAQECHARVVVTGTVADISVCEKIGQLSGQKIINLCAGTTLKELAALFEMADFAVCPDTGAMHIASAVGTPVICLLGPTSLAVTGPRGKGPWAVVQKDVGCVIPCYQANCRDYRCMSAIAVEDVMEKVLELGSNL